MKNVDSLTLADATTQRLNEYLFTNNISLIQFAKKSEIPLSTLKNLYRKHTKSPTLTLIFKIAKGMEITPAELIDSPIFNDSRIDLE